MERKSTRYYILLSLSIPAVLLVTIFIAVYLVPKSIYLVPPIVVMIGYIKPVGARISFRNALLSLVYLIIGNLLAYLVAEGNDAARGTFISVSLALLYLGCIKDRGARS
ncbi:MULTISPECIES: hypothetical protein [unclassified Mesorhizobium]|uniref:hypothetical protein n=1 Tax=unclassified Mesorhizobium TaxID=325217 RepID=UPI000FE6D6A2|nr:MULTISPECIES: hypothetical protein [unclassified Mesorhizobium]RWC73861.1 MAG: hypothetical protein EOS71_15385 [Mesorhizobium sp.]TGV09907.1 hypothetical protein EN816_29175 [Mesorhizobium sp. M8A.F.Ca.ET.173.01.1.1]TGW06798.1 hypothetical protein EN788_40225 [Mesorhizobium sp. M2D.F.Ca.ET.145.01.1.1]TGT89964.1 hypothetical protein EN804_13960 [Mesorhizobium sp. M8A.F.Ca.ET.161.01.1.1]TGV42522.1 hypothetical protein EN785_13945 [Mesorhizobium sp. M8A.F.Ca.ET.142.01.1.1]